MRRALNENPVVQVVMLGALGIVVAFLFMTRVVDSDGGAEEASTAPTTPASAATSPAAPDAPPVTAASAEAAPATGLGFEAGAGLPRRVVDAYEGGDVVALLVLQRRGAEDRKLEAEAQALRARGDTTVFVVEAKDVAAYSRIAEGVNLDRVPALVVIEPKRQADGELPLATISYGFRGPQSLEQAIRDALYEGKRLPYHPG